MRFFAVILAFIFSISVSYSQGRVNPNYHKVQGHYRKDGTYVKPHYRTDPNSTNRDNYSTKGNINPFTFEPGTIPPDNKNLSSNPSHQPFLTGNVSTIASHRTGKISTSPQVKASVSDLSAISNKDKSEVAYDLSGGNRFIYYLNGHEEFQVVNPTKILYDKKRMYYSYDIYTNEIRESLGSIHGQLLLNGYYRFIDKSGSIKHVANYWNGLKHGFSISYDDTGEIIEKSEYYFGELRYFKFTDYDGSIIEMKGIEGKRGSFLLISNLTGLLKKIDFLGNGRTKSTEYEPITKRVIREYYSIDEKLNGEYRHYFLNGKLKEKLNYHNGLLSGPFELYSEDGYLSVKGSLLGGKLHGEVVKYYDNRQIKEKVFYSNGLLNGSYVFYENLKPSITGFYNYGKQHGRWNHYLIDSNVYYLIQWNTFNNGILDGPFREIRGDSICVGFYKDGYLNGDFHVYQPLLLKTKGQSPEILNSKDLICIGQFLDGHKSGHWKYYSFLNNNLLEEGDYLQGKKHGEWRYYIDLDMLSEVIVGGVRSNKSQLSLIENYLYGEKNGRSERICYLDEMIVQCDTTIGTVNPFDTCYQLVLRKIKEIVYYKQGQLHGPFEYRDAKDQLVRKGEFRMGKKYGQWIEYYTNPLDSNEIFKLETNYSNDKLNGSFKKINANTEIILEEGKYFDGQKIGIWRIYFPDNQKRIDCLIEYVNGKRISAKSFDYDGRLTLSAEYQGGNLFSIERIDTLNKRPVERVENIFFNTGTYNYDNTIFGDTIVRFHRVFEAGHSIQEQDPLIFLSLINLFNQFDPEKIYISGPFTLRSSSGKIIREGSILRDKKSGVWKDYFYNDKVIREIKYESGEKVFEQYLQLGTNTPYSGKIVLILTKEGYKLVINVKKGLRNGYTLEYDLNGKLIKKTKYKAGKVVKQ
ncbi:MAG: hypothetical protein J0L99_00930 [Chitinophagales bacterium]|nr:hypothetical protein [Chitinophagales bacterium]